MKKVLGFYRTALQTLNPGSYEDFSESTTKNSFGYYSALIVNAFIIMILLMIPTALQLPNTINSYFANVDTLTFNNEFVTNAPLMFPKENPVFIVNYNNQSVTQPAKVILNNNVLHYGFLFNQYEYNFAPLKDGKAKSSDVSTFVAIALILMAPTALLIFFIYILLKYFLIIVGAAIIAKIISEVVRYRVDFKKLFNCAVYGITLTIFLDLIFFALGIWYYYIQYLPLALFLIAGIAKNGEKVVSEKHRKYVEVKG